MDFQDFPASETINEDVREYRETPGAVLIDVRLPEEYEEGHIPGSLNINVKDEQFSSCVDDLLDKNRRKVAVYCRSGRRSRTAAEILTKKGFKVYNLDKGILNWIEEGREIEK